MVEFKIRRTFSSLVFLEKSINIIVFFEFKFVEKYYTLGGFWSLL